MYRPILFVCLSQNCANQYQHGSENKKLGLLQRTLLAEPVRPTAGRNGRAESSDLDLVQTAYVISSLNIGLPASHVRCGERRSLTKLE